MNDIDLVLSSLNPQFTLCLAFDKAFVCVHFARLSAFVLPFHQASDTVYVRSCYDKN